eukprot:980757-Rhodomonas_salina.2
MHAPFTSQLTPAFFCIDGSLLASRHYARGQCRGSRVSEEIEASRDQSAKSTDAMDDHGAASSAEEGERSCHKDEEAKQEDGGAETEHDGGKMKSPTAEFQGTSGQSFPEQAATVKVEADPCRGTVPEDEECLSYDELQHTSLASK